MGRKRIDMEPILDDRTRRITFKKRRIGLIKKALQLTKLSGAQVQLKIYNPEDKSFVEFHSHSDDAFDQIIKECDRVSEYAKFLSSHYDLVKHIEA